MATSDIDSEVHLTLAKQLNNATYGLLDGLGQEPSAAAVAAAVHSAHAAAHHWSIAGGAVQQARATYLCSRVHAYAGFGATALWFADRCAALLAEAGDDAKDWDHSFALEARARALACLGRADEARAAVDAVWAMPIADDEDREIVHGDLVAGPWFGVTVQPPPSN